MNDTKATKEVTKIKNRISRGTKYWEKENKAKFERFRRYLRIKHYPDSDTMSDQVTVAFIHALLRAKLPSLYYRNPESIVKPKKKLSPDKVQATLENTSNAQTALDYMVEEIGLEDEVRSAVLDYVGFGRGIVKIGFEYEVEGLAPTGVVKRTLSKVKDFVTGQQTPTEEEVKILVDRFYVKRISYPNGYFIYDPEATRGLSDSRWCAEKIIEPLEDVKANKNFKNTSDLHSNMTIKKELSFDKLKEDEDEARLEYYHYWEKNRFGVVNKCVYIVPDQDVILKETKNIYEHNEFPYKELNNYEIPDYLFPVGDIESIEAQQQQLDVMESIQTAHARAFIQKYVYNKGKLNSKQLAQLKEPINSFVEVDEEAGLRALENPTVNQTVPMTTDLIKMDMTKITGVSEYDTATIPRTETTLGEAKMVQGGANSRKEGARKDVERFVKNVYRQLFQVIQQYMTEDMLLQITDDDKQSGWSNLTSEQIQGEFDIDIQPYSATPIDKERLRQDNLLLYKTFQMDPTVPLEGKNQLRKWVLEAFDKKDASLFDTQVQQTPGGPGEAQPTVDQNGKPINSVPLQGPPQPQGPPPPEPQKPSESISFKDLPPEGKVQMAKQAGIELSPEGIVAYEKAAALAKKPINQPAKKAGTK